MDGGCGQLESWFCSQLLEHDLPSALNTSIVDGDKLQHVPQRQSLTTTCFSVRGVFFCVRSRVGVLRRCWRNVAESGNSNNIFLGAAQNDAGSLSRDVEQHARRCLKTLIIAFLCQQWLYFPVVPCALACADTGACSCFSL